MNDSQEMERDGFWVKLFEALNPLLRDLNITFYFRYTHIIPPHTMYVHTYICYFTYISFYIIKGNLISPIQIQYHRLHSYFLSFPMYNSLI